MRTAHNVRLYSTGHRSQHKARMYLLNRLHLHEHTRFCFTWVVGMRFCLQSWVKAPHPVWIRYTGQRTFGGSQIQGWGVQQRPMRKPNLYHARACVQCANLYHALAAIMRHYYNTIFSQWQHNLLRGMRRIALSLAGSAVLVATIS